MITLEDIRIVSRHIDHPREISSIVQCVYDFLAGN